MEIVKTKSNRGGEVLFVNSFKFNIVQKNNDSTKVRRWRCSVRGCTAKLHTKGE